MRYGLLSLLLLASCPNPQPQTGCSPMTCLGCCDLAGACQAGLSTAACGALGAQCTPCGAAVSCVGGVCTPQGAGGGSATDPSALISGSRLRAINRIGNDGAKAPFNFPDPSYFSADGFFWDTELTTYCSLGLARFIPSYTDHCFPVTYALSNPKYFSNAGCTTPSPAVYYALLELPFLDAGLPAGTPVYLEADGGLFTAVSSPGSVYERLDDGGCGLTAHRAFTPGAPIPPSSLVSFRVTLD